MRALELFFALFLTRAHASFAVKRREAKVVEEERVFADGVVNVVWLVLAEGEVFQAVVGDGFLDG